MSIYTYVQFVFVVIYGKWIIHKKILTPLPSRFSVLTTQGCSQKSLILLPEEVTSFMDDPKRKLFQKLFIKCLWKWQQVSISHTFYEQLLWNVFVFFVPCSNYSLTFKFFVERISAQKLFVIFFCENGYRTRRTQTRDRGGWQTGCRDLSDYVDKFLVCWKTVVAHQDHQDPWAPKVAKAKRGKKEFQVIKFETVEVYNISYQP